jgi:hypothetical protein
MLRASGIFGVNQKTTDEVMTEHLFKYEDFYGVKDKMITFM